MSYNKNMEENTNINREEVKQLIDKKGLIGEILSSPDLFGVFGLSEFLDTEDIKYFDDLDIFEENGNIYLNCLIKKKPKLIKSDKGARPEEIIRQLYLIKLIKYYKYPISNIDIERPVQFGREVVKRDDIVVYRDSTQKEEYIIIEVKKPDIKEGIEQLKGYANATGAPLLVLTDGKTTNVLERTDPNLFENLTDLPKYGQTTDDIRNEKLTYQMLEVSNDLRQLVQDLENTILANAGVNPFDEIFKLIYAKLYDEIVTPRNEDRKFKVTSRSNQEHLEVIKDLFEKAKKQWGEGVFKNFETIDIPVNVIIPAISMLQKYRIYNGNFQVIDEAFEYLITSDSKGEKGQYFTPRFVIDMCVKMLNPKQDEYMIDTAAGSCGFPVHTMQYVNEHEINESNYGEDTRESQKGYAQEHLYAIDFDPRATKISKAVMLIAGDGKTNVVNANTLDPVIWSNDTKAILNNRLLPIEDHQQNEENKKNFYYFDFDLVMTNPPFAGDVNGQILYKYELGRSENGKVKNKISRDILFIERNLNFLKPGGRMAIVLPQGTLNNTSLEQIRNFITKKAKILAVISLGVNTFKPHTGTKTSVLFLQKWSKDEKPLSNYSIFMAVSQKSGKNNSGDYDYIKEENGDYRLDSSGNRIYNTDLMEIAEKFIEWGKKEKFNFL
ncbi:MAG: Type I site-specific deoxyribonuclease [Berkelbacteria bacterium GW2011_GWA1_36_9]|uniref:Type I site-specific deoxyribonuclease n=1 Tax=Berkelbacteria bacterium GW2011_GWA1_36_9 TaxID=1618331 RepID=A0A0G0I1U0_9BACT|nr:MAG: Type I site-specific deoxyribonuclease [Berkelbacteria bacterium GW2011_GWA1_36_9]